MAIAGRNCNSDWRLNSVVFTVVLFIIDNKYYINYY